MKDSERNQLERSLLAPYRWIHGKKPGKESPLQKGKISLRLHKEPDPQRVLKSEIYSNSITPEGRFQFRHRLEYVYPPAPADHSLGAQISRKAHTHGGKTWQMRMRAPDQLQWFIQILIVSFLCLFLVTMLPKVRKWYMESHEKRLDGYFDR